MDGDVLAFAQVMIVIVCSLGGVVFVGLMGRILWRLGSRVRHVPIAPVADDARLARLETAVESIAIEVERISEAQRFTVSVLTERLPARTGDRLGELAGPGAPKRINTPH